MKAQQAVLAPPTVTGPCWLAQYLLTARLFCVSFLTFYSYLYHVPRMVGISSAPSCFVYAGRRPSYPTNSFISYGLIGVCNPLDSSCQAVEQMKGAPVRTRAGGTVDQIVGPRFGPLVHWRACVCLCSRCVFAYVSWHARRSHPQSGRKGLSQPLLPLLQLRLPMPIRSRDWLYTHLRKSTYPVSCRLVFFLVFFVLGLFCPLNMGMLVLSWLKADDFGDAFKASLLILVSLTSTVPFLVGSRRAPRSW